LSAFSSQTAERKYGLFFGILRSSLYSNCHVDRTDYLSDELIRVQIDYAILINVLYIYAILINHVFAVCTSTKSKLPIHYLKYYGKIQRTIDPFILSILHLIL
jgi:hypothetical protein